MLLLIRSDFWEKRVASVLFRSIRIRGRLAFTMAHEKVAGRRGDHASCLIGISLTLG